MKTNKIILLIALGFAFLCASATQAAVRTTTTSGNWNVTGTWVGGTIPAAGDDVVIQSTHQITNTVSTNINSITFSNNATTARLTVLTSATNTVAAGITVQNAANANRAATLAGAGRINCASVTVGGTTTTLSGDATTILTNTLAFLNISGNLNINGEDDGANDNDPTVKIESGTVSVGGTVVCDEENGSTVTLTLASGAQTGTLILAGATPFNNAVGTLTFTASGTGATVNYSGANQTANPVTYQNLTLSGSGTKTTTGVTVNGTLSRQSTATVSVAPTYGSGATLEYKGSAAQSSGPELTATINNLTINNASGVSLTNSPTVTSNLNLTIGALTIGAQTLTLNGAISTTSGTLTGGAASSIAFGGTSASTTLPSVTLSNLTVNRANGIALASGVTVSNTLTLTVGAVTSAGNLTLGNGATISRATGSLSGTPNFGSTVNVTYTGSTAVTNGTEIPTSPTILNNLTPSNSGGVTLNTSPTVNGTLTFSTGKIATGTNTLIIGAGGAISGASTNGYVNGNLQRIFGSTGGGQSFAFAIGDATRYAPASLANVDVTVAGGLTAKTTGSEHPSIATSGIDSTKSVNRYCTLTGDGSLAVSTYDATFNYLTNDVDAGVTAANFAVRNFNSPNWTTTAISGTPTTTGASISGQTTFGDFAVGNQAVNTIEFGQQPTDTTASTVISPAITTTNLDLLGVGVPSSVVLTLTSGTGTLSGTTTQPANSAGVATFTNLSINLVGTNKQLTATSSGKTAVSSTFSINLGPLSQFSFAAIGAQTAGTPFNIVITAQDAGGNTTEDFTNTVDLATTAGTIAPTTSDAFISGVVTQTVMVTGAGAGKTITASNTVSTASGTFTVNPSTLDHYSVTVSSPNNVNVPFTTTVTARDSNSNTVTAATNPVTLSGTGSVNFDSNGDNTYGDVTKNLTAGVLTIATKDDVAETVDLTATDANTKTGTLTGVSITTAIGAYKSHSSGNWNSATVWDKWSGTEWTNTATPPSSADSVITITNGCSITNTTTISVDQVIVESGAKLVLSSTLTIAAGPGTDMDVFGTLVAASTPTVTGTIVFEPNSLYQHNQNGGTIPTATWAANSTCEVTGWGASTTAPGGITQNFGNFVWNSPGHSGALSLGGGLNTVNGNFTVTSTGSGSLSLGGTGAGNLAIVGNFSQTAGNFIGSGSAARTVTINGNLSLTGGTFNLSTSTTAGNAVTVSVAGNFTHTAGTMTETGSTTGSGIIFTSGTHDFASGGAVANVVSFTVNNSATLRLGTNLVGSGSSGAFTLNSGGSLELGDAAGITTSGASGNIRVSGTRTYNTGANYKYNGSTPQVTGNGLPATVNNLTIDNAAGVGLTRAATTTVSGTCLVTTNAILGMGTNVIAGGTFTLSDSATLAIGSAAGIASSGATGNIQTITRNFDTNANYHYVGLVAQITGTGLPASVRNLVISNAADLTLTASATVNNSLELASGKLMTGVNQINLALAASISGGGINSYVAGNLEKEFASGAGQTFTFPIGDALFFTPAALANLDVTTDGTLLANTTGGEHPNISTSGIESIKDANRYWSFTTGGGFAVTNYDITVNYVTNDLDAGVNPLQFIVRHFSGGNWFETTLGVVTPASAQALGVSSFSDFAIGQQVTASAYQITAANSTPPAGDNDALTITMLDGGGSTLTVFTGDKTLTFSGLADAPNGAHPTVTDKTGAAKNLGTATTIHFTNGVSSDGGILVAKKAEGPVTLEATDGVASTTSSNGFGVSLTISAAAADNLTFTSQPGSATAGSPFGSQPVVKITDQFGNISATGLPANLDLSLTITGGTGALLGTTNLDIGTAAGNGTATFTNLQIDVAGTNKQLTASAVGFSNFTSSVFVVSPAAASVIEIQTQPSTNATAGAAFAQQPVLRLKDAHGNLADNDSATIVTAARNAGSGALQGTTTATAANGIVTFTNLSHNVASTITIDFTSGALTPATSDAIVVSPAAANQLAIQTQPSTNATAGLAFTNQPVILIQDQFGNLVTNENSTIVTATRDAGAGDLQGETNITAIAGVVTFTNLSHIVATNITITFTSGSLSNATSETIVVTPATADRLVFTAQPGSAAAGSPFGSQPAVKTTDQFGNDSTTELPGSLNVDMTLTTGSGTLFGTTTFDIGTNSGNGSVTFTNLQIDAAGTNKQLTASATGLTNAVSDTFTVVAASADHLESVQGDGQSAVVNTSVTLDPTVRVVDAFGNPTAGADVTFTVLTGGGAVGSSPGMADSNGLAGTSFTLGTTAGTSNNSMEASASLPGSPTNITFTASAVAAAADHLTIQTQPSTNATAGVAFAQQPVIRVEDEFGNLRSSDNSTTVSATRADGSGTLQGVTTVTAANGLATFTNLSHNVANDITIEFTSGSLTNVISGTITINPAAANQIQISTQPSTNATAGVAFAQQPVVQLKDAFGNACVNDSSTVVTASRSAGSGTLQGDTSTTVSGGMGTFTNLFHTVAGDITLNFVGSGLTNAISDTITIAPATADHLAFTTQPGNAGVGSPFGTQPVVSSQDQFGNNSTVGLSANLDLSIALTSGAGALSGTTNFDIGTGAGNGAVTFTNLAIDVADTNKQLTASAAGFTNAVSATFTVGKGDQTIAFDSLSDATYGDADFDVSATASSGLPVSFSIASGPATISGNTVSITGAGVVTVTASQAGDDDWNAATDVDQSLTVTKAVITVTADDKTRVYGAVNPPFSVGYDGFVNGDGFEILNGFPGVFTTAVSNSPVAGSPYPIVVTNGTLSAADYSFAFVNGALTITKASSATAVTSSLNPALPGSNVTFTATLTAVAPGGGTPGGVVQFVIDGSTFAPVAVSGGLASTNTSTLSHGNHTVVARYTGDGNFIGSTNILVPDQLINLPPRATNDVLLTHKNVAVSVTNNFFKQNDVDPDGDAFSFTSVSAASAQGGTVSLSAGTVTYTPPSGYTGADSFTYVITDSFGATNIGTVNVTVSVPVIISVALLPDRNFRLTLSGIPGYTYAVQATTNVSPTSWTSIGTNTTAPNGLFTFDDLTATNRPRRFYRGQYLP